LAAGSNVVGSACQTRPETLPKDVIASLQKGDESGCPAKPIDIGSGIFCSFL